MESSLVQAKRESKQREGERGAVLSLELTRNGAIWAISQSLVRALGYTHVGKQSLLGKSMLISGQVCACVCRYRHARSTLAHAARFAHTPPEHPLISSLSSLPPFLQTLVEASDLNKFVDAFEKAREALDERLLQQQQQQQQERPASPGGNSDVMGDDDDGTSLATVAGGGLTSKLSDVTVWLQTASGKDRMCPGAHTHSAHHRIVCTQHSNATLTAEHCVCCCRYVRADLLRLCGT